MAQGNKPIAVVKPMWRDPIVTEMEQAIKAVASLIYQRQEDQRRMEEHMQRWETRWQGMTMLPELQALNEHIAEKLDELETRIRQLDPEKYAGYTSCHRQLLLMQRRDTVDMENTGTQYRRSSPSYRRRSADYSDV